jgi:hypothetical protein
MRKRTYTAINEPKSCVSIWGADSQDVSVLPEKKKFVQTTDEKVGHSSHEQPTSVFDTPDSKLGVSRSDSLHDLNKYVTPVCGDITPPYEDDGIPLTTIHNLVGTCEFFSSVQPIDLEYVYHCLPNSYYNRQRFAAITIRVTEPVCTGLLFTSGKLVVTGTTPSQHDTEQAKY